MYKTYFVQVGNGEGFLVYETFLKTPLKEVQIDENGFYNFFTADEVIIYDPKSDKATNVKLKYFRKLLILIILYICER